MAATLRSVGSSLALLLCLLASSADAAVAFFAVNSASGTDTSVNISIDLGSGSNRGVVAMCSNDADTVGIAATVNGESMPIITGTDGGAATGTVMLAKATTSSGVQTVAISWTNSQHYDCGVMAFSGVNQDSNQQNNFNGGQQNGGGASPQTLTVTSTSGDLTTSVAANTIDGTMTTNQTQKYSTNGGVDQGDIGGGSGTTAHTWTRASATVYMSALNIVQAAVTTTTTPRRTLTGVGQ